MLSSPSVESENQLGQTGESNDIESDAVDSPEETKLDSLISPSPLVSWCADCTVERGRQLFFAHTSSYIKNIIVEMSGPI